jgi:hypothetical protein
VDLSALPSIQMETAPGSTASLKSLDYHCSNATDRVSRDRMAPNGYPYNYTRASGGALFLAEGARLPRDLERKLDGRA